MEATWLQGSYTSVPHDYDATRHVPCIVLVVDDLGREYAEHSIQALKKGRYDLEADKGWSLYCGIQLDWNYKDRILEISIPKYTIKVL